jgi:hypothetical protein
VTEHIALLHRVCAAFVDAVKAGGDLGAPAGVMYAAVMDQMSLDQFEQLMGALVATRKVRREGDRFFWLADL